MNLIFCARGFLFFSENLGKSPRVFVFLRKKSDIKMDPKIFRALRARGFLFLFSNLGKSPRVLILIFDFPDFFAWVTN